MPPKQKEAKKGPTYRQPIPLKDIVPPELKEPPREQRPLKLPQSVPEPPKNQQSLPPLFQDWPSDESIRTHDFGLQSEVKFNDPFHDQLLKFLGKEAEADWKNLNELQPSEELTEGESEAEEEKGRSQNQIQSFKNLEKEEEIGGPCVIETFLRPETEEEMQARQKEEAEKAEKAAKDKKKANKKEEPKEEGPLQVSDVRLSDVLCRRNMGPAASWIGSQLQLIKLRSLTDVVSGEPVWKKIYPQENGVPQMTRSGKYWVKLLHMGKYVKVEVDDRVPFDHKNRPLFPRSAKFNERWPLILAKAVAKYLAKAGMGAITGSGLVAYALTGRLSERISLSQFKQWAKLEQLLGNDHYIKRDVVVGCFADNFGPFRRTIKRRIEREEGEDEWEEKEIDSKVMGGYSYCLADYLDSEGFNMVFSQEKSQKEMLLKHEYNELAKITLTNKTREEKLEYRRRKKELKEKLAAEEKKRLELISRPAQRQHFLKLLGAVKLECDYGEKEILLAKKCLLNKLTQPPNYDVPMEKEQKDTKSLQSISVSMTKYKQESELFPNIHDFSALPNVQELHPRPDRGIWLQDQDLLHFFTFLQVLYDPTAFVQRKQELIQSKKASSFTADQNKQILVVERSEQQEGQRLRLLLGCAFQSSPHDPCPPYTLVQKFDFSALRATSEVVRLGPALGSRLVDLGEQNSVFRLLTLSRGNYHLWVSSDAPCKLLSLADYLTEYEGYTRKVLPFEYAAVEAGNYSPIFRIKLKYDGQTDNSVLLKLLNVREELLSCLNFRLVTVSDPALTSQQQQGIILRKAETTLIAHEYSRITLQPNTEYYLIVEAQPEESISEGGMELLLLSREEGLTADVVEQVEPVRVMEKYAANKYALICQERIFTNADNSASLTLRLSEFEEVAGGGAGKGAKKGGKDESAPQLQQKPFTDVRSIALKILSGESVLYEAVGQNQITIPNFKFLSTKGTGREYTLQAKFDLREWPEAAQRSDKTDKISWVLQIFSQQTLALVRDTKQEDKQKQTRKSWEDSEPGRAERAKKARRKFLLQVKKEKGEQLTEQEEQILNAPRLTKKQQMEEDKKNEDKKGGKGGKKDDKKGGKDAKKEEVVEQKPPERPAPRSQDNFTTDIRSFLQILQSSGIRHEPANGEPPRIRSDEELRSIRQGAVMAGENRVGKLIRSIQQRQTVKLREKEKKDALSITFNEARQQLKEKYTAYLDWRAQDVEKDRARQDKERLLIDIISQEKPTITEPDLRKHITEYRDIPAHNPHLADVADMVRKNIRISAITDKISALLLGWEVEELKNIDAEIKNDRIEGIEGEVARQMKEMLEEAEKNPGLAAEKQAEAKKGKKGGKK